MKAKGLVKVYGATRALAGVSAEFDQGKVTVIEGPNGSGKSTLMTILAQLSRPTRGTVLYGQHDGQHKAEELRGKLGVLAHAGMVYPDLTGRENIELFASMYGVANPAQRADALVERFEIGKFFERPTRTYSRGQLQRVALARAVVHSPRLLLLDEPSTGLDYRGVDRLVRMVEQEREAGTIQVLVTHDAGLIERICDVRIRMKRGRVEDVLSGDDAKRAGDQV